MRTQVGHYDDEARKFVWPYEDGKKILFHEFTREEKDEYYRYRTHDGEKTGHICQRSSAATKSKVNEQLKVLEQMVMAEDIPEEKKSVYKLLFISLKTGGTESPLTKLFGSVSPLTAKVSLTWLMYRNGADKFENTEITMVEAIKEAGDNIQLAFTKDQVQQQLKAIADSGMVLKIEGLD